jgi:hypothetical protein
MSCGLEVEFTSSMFAAPWGPKERALPSFPSWSRPGYTPAPALFLLPWPLHHTLNPRKLQEARKNWGLVLRPINHQHASFPKPRSVGNPGEALSGWVSLGC